MPNTLFFVDVDDHFQLALRLEENRDRSPSVFSDGLVASISDTSLQGHTSFFDMISIIDVVIIAL